MHVLRLAKHLSSEEFRSIVICPNGQFTDELTWAHVPYTIIPMANKFDVRAIFAIRKIITKQKMKDEASPIIIHCHGVRAGLLGRLAAKAFPYPIVYTEHLWTKDYHLPHKLNEQLQLAMLRYLDRYTTKTIGVSQAVVDFLSQAKIVPRAKLTRIYNAATIPAKPIFREGNSQAIIGTVGSLTWQKNYSYLIELFAKVHQSLPTARLEIVGEGPKRRELEALIAKYGLSEAVKLHGAPPHESIIPIQQRWSLYVQSSINESFGLAMAEAVTHGLPAVSSRLASATEVLGTKNALFDFDDMERTAEKIVQLLKNKEKRRELYDQEYATVKQFDVPTMIKAHEALYTALVNLEAKP